VIQAVAATDAAAVTIGPPLTVPGGSMKMYPALFLSVSFFMLASCATTNYEAFESRTNAVVHGQGGTESETNGMAIWDAGEPPRDFIILGFINDDRPGGLIPMAELKGDIVKKARAVGGDAVILIHSDSQVAGYYSTATANAYASGNSATAYGTSVSMPLMHHSSRFAVIKFVQ